MRRVNSTAREKQTPAKVLLKKRRYPKSKTSLNHAHLRALQKAISIRSIKETKNDHAWE
jgi:hypothetical protein